MKANLKEKAARFGGIASGYLALALLLTWPLVANLGRAVPAGSEPPTVSLHQLFLMEHNANYLDGRVSYFDAAFFHPHPGTFAWSEPQPLSGALFWLFGKLGAGPTLAYNLLVLLYLVSAGLLAYLLTRQLVEDRLVAFMSGAWVCAGAYMLHQLCVLHLLAVTLPAWFLHSLIELRREFRTRALVGLACAYVLTWLTCAQFGMFLTLLIPVAFFSLFGLRELDWKKWLKLAAAGVIAGLLLLPLLMAQHARLESMGLGRSMSDVRGNFHIHDFFLPAKGHWLSGRLLGFDQRTDIYSWDPGLVLLATLLVALALGLWRSIRKDPAQKRLVRTHFLLFVTALLLGFGPRLGVWIDGSNYGPYSLLAAIVPGLDGIRSPARLAAFMTLSLSVMSAGALVYLRGKLNRRWELAFLAGIGVLLLAEAWTLPVKLVATAEQSTGHMQAVAWIGQQQGDGVVLELPLASGNRPADLEGEVRAMRRMLTHGHPIVNGYSAHFPKPFWQLARAIKEDPGGRGLRFIRALGVRYVLLNPDRSGIAPVLERAAEKVHVFDDGVLIFELAPADSGVPIVIPGSTKLRRPPQEDNMLRIKLGQPLDQAGLFMAGDDRTLRVEWQGGSGEWQDVDLKVFGSLLLDQGAKVVHLLITDLPLLGSTGRARPISEAEARLRSRGTYSRDPHRTPDGDSPARR